jgi:molybdopterin-guanine dinucleotide biosynthesis protein A
MGGGDKTSLVVGGRPMLDRVLDAVEAAASVVVVGPSRPAERAVRWCREDPPGGGPAAAIAAALPFLAADMTVVVAGDQPLVSPVVVDLLVASVTGDGAVGLDSAGRPQWLLSAWRTDALRRGDFAAGVSLRDTLGELRWRGVSLPDECTADCDTPDDVRRAEAVLVERSRSS